MNDRKQALLNTLQHRRKITIIMVLLISLGILTTTTFMGGGKEEVKATWIWDVEQIQENPEKTISFAKQQNVNLIYVHVSINEFSPKLYRSFIKEASKQDINVYALGGDPTWALTKNQDSLDKFVSQVKNYNRVVPEEQKFEGIHLDVEPYLLPEWKKDQNEVIEQWLMNTASVVDQAKANTELAVSGDFPFWVHKLNVPGSSQKVSEWMLNKLDSITIMAYRDYTEGTNGIKSIVTPLVDQAHQHNKSVIVGVNVIDTSEGSHTTFHGNEPGQMATELDKLENQFNDHGGYAGIAIHDYKHWKTNVH
ncbi:hypothetical protein [Pontibacillus yanchengensis]|uniref:hypothetical protein n=1 Tax=Pontibacillus yanchengensis TaxID=462910 RepID=UPI00056838B2|nr:hypothetical protein [Pontibacillus yanchengensis]